MDLSQLQSLHNKKQSAKDNEASVIPIMIKRKKEYLTNVFHHYIRPKRIRKAIDYLMDKYPFYEKSTFDTDKLQHLENICIDEIEEVFGDESYFAEPGDELLIEEIDEEENSTKEKTCFNEKIWKKKNIYKKMLSENTKLMSVHHPSSYQKIFQAKCHTNLKSNGKVQCFLLQEKVKYHQIFYEKSIHLYRIFQSCFQMEKGDCMVKKENLR